MAEPKTTESKTAEPKEEIVTETTILGVTESGVIRKRSVKRRISKESEDHHAKADRKYGHDVEDYKKILERLLAERVTSNALELLQERWRMLTYMYEDCMELVKQWDEQRLMKKHQRRKRRLLFLSFISMPIVLMLVTWLVTKWWW